MNYRLHQNDDVEAIIDCFTDTFTHFDGDSEGALIRGLAADLFKTTQPQYLLNFVAEEAGHIAGSIFFTHMFSDSATTCYLLAPVAVRPNFQRQGIGQSLIRYGLKILKADYDATVAVTYGDPTFYSRVGFQAISENNIQPPYRLSQPEGWLGQSLTDQPIRRIKLRLECVEAFQSPAYW